MNNVLKCFYLKEQTIENTQRTLAAIPRLGVNITRIFMKGQIFTSWVMVMQNIYVSYDALDEMTFLKMVPQLRLHSSVHLLCSAKKRDGIVFQ